MSRRIDDLHPVVRELAKVFLALVEEAGHKVLVYSTLRTWEEQRELYARGRTKPGPRVTNAPPGHSWHNWGLAFDIVLLDPRSRAVWDPRANLDNDALLDYDEIGTIAQRIGLEWGKRFSSWDLGHFQHRLGFQILDLLAGRGGRVGLVAPPGYLNSSPRSSSPGGTL